MEGPVGQLESRDASSYSSTRPIRRAASGRFPIKLPNANATAEDSLAVPPIPKHSLRSQNASAQSSSRRGAQSSFGSASERLRSNSESLLQATRTKRMGIVPKKNGDLAPLDEQRIAKHNHLRGLSHGSLLEDKGLNGHKQSSPVGSVDLERSRDHYVRRLSSLPEKRRDVSKANTVIEGAKGVLYGLYQVHPHISNLISFVRENVSKRTSLEPVFYNVSTHVEELDREIQKYEAREEEDDSSRTTDGVKHACVTCVRAYHHMGTLLLENTTKIAVGGDQRYVRTLLLLLYGCVVEIRNACRILPVNMQEKPFGQPHVVNGTIRPAHQRPTGPLARMRGNVADSNSSFRSGSLSSNAIATPLSSEGFALPQTPSTLSLVRVSSQTDESEEEHLFERIFIGLRIATEAANTNLPLINDYFMRRIEYCKKTESRTDIGLWTTLFQYCAAAIKESGEMRSRLSTLKIREPSVRGQRSFWELANAFVRGFVELALRIKNAKESQLIPIDVLQALRPVQKSVKEVGILIETSPWRTISKPAGQARDTHTVMANPSFSNSVPYITPMPATPLSAALGPAAQATIPSTPLSTHPYAPGAGAYDRADSLLSMPARSLTTAVTENYLGPLGLGMTSTVLSPTGLRKEPKASAIG